MTTKEMAARIAELEAQIAKRDFRELTFKVSEKGALSVYGMGRFPVTLYASQWERLLADAPKIDAFIKATDKALARQAS